MLLLELLEPQATAALARECTRLRGRKGVDSPLSGRRGGGAAAGGAAAGECAVYEAAGEPAAKAGEEAGGEAGEAAGLVSEL